MNEQLRARLRWYAARFLVSLIQEMSEDIWCAGWCSRIEYALWDYAQGGEGVRWRGGINPIERFLVGWLKGANVPGGEPDPRAFLRQLADDAGGWWMYGDEGEAFVALEEWGPRFRQEWGEVTTPATKNDTV